MPYETIIIETPDNEKLHGYLIKQMNQSNERETLVFFHGNAGNIGHRYELYENKFSLICELFTALKMFLGVYLDIPIFMSSHFRRTREIITYAR
jgi:hypothetical protein